MNFSQKEALQLADDIVFSKTGNHLSDLQIAIIQGILENHKYKQIAKDFDCSESNVANIASELWKILSDELGEKVNRYNLRVTLERSKNSNIINYAQNVSDSFNICGESDRDSGSQSSNEYNCASSSIELTDNYYHALDEMPELEIESFYNRHSELEKLKKCLQEQHCRLISITGISGIGKTKLAVKLVQQVQDDFEYIVWFNLTNPFSLKELQTRLLYFLPNLEKENYSVNQLLFKCFQQFRCLVILDDIHNLFSKSELSGKYQPHYEQYQIFFKQLRERSHQSCVLIIGWEQPRDFWVWETESYNSYVYAGQLKGLELKDGQQILQDNGLDTVDEYKALIHSYQGNPLWLKIVVNQIQDLGLTASDVVEDNKIIIPESLKDIFNQYFERLSQIEKQVLIDLTKFNKPIVLTQLLEKSNNSKLNILNALHSLLRRYLIEKQNGQYIVLPILRQYIIETQTLDTFS
ncbi:MAG: NB-ARC domain-containing protein [Spirulinaceae cyanobacterium]